MKTMEEMNIAKARLLYDFLDQTEFYHAPVAKEDRSRMNVPISRCATTSSTTSFSNRPTPTAWCS